MIRCIVVDDEQLAIDLIVDHIAKTDEIQVVDTFLNAIDALSYLNQNPTIDLIFLDIQLPQLSGIDFMKIHHSDQRIILTTAYDQYALGSYDYDVLDYLLKPITYDRFLSAIEKYRQQSIELKTTDKSYMFVKVENRTVRIDFDSILFLEGYGDYVKIHEIGESILVLERLKKFEQLLPKQGFVRVHKSYIVALEKINQIENNEIQIKKHRIPIGETYKKEFWDKIRL